MKIYTEEYKKELHKLTFNIHKSRSFFKCVSKAWNVFVEQFKLYFFDKIHFVQRAKNNLEITQYIKETTEFNKNYEPVFDNALEFDEHPVGAINPFICDCFLTSDHSDLYHNEFCKLIYVFERDHNAQFWFGLTFVDMEHFDLFEWAEGFDIFIEKDKYGHE